MQTFTHYILGLGPTLAYVAIFFTIFAESGLLIGFILPGDSLLIPAGLLAQHGNLNIFILCAVTGIATIIGNQVGYIFGKQVGPALFNRPDSRLFSKSRLKEAHAFYDKYGVQALVLGRFVPFARTFIPILAGVSEMNYQTFMLYNVIGGILWTSGVTLLGYFLSKAIPNIDNYVLLIVVIVLVLSVLPIVIKLLKHRSKA